MYILLYLKLHNALYLVSSSARILSKFFEINYSSFHFNSFISWLSFAKYRNSTMLILCNEPLATSNNKNTTDKLTIFMSVLHFMYLDEMHVDLMSC
jgi:hypothetical protein